ncbi:hypothetical protein OROHE_014798 [Orobanche hederae]
MDGVLAFLQFAVGNLKMSTNTIPCPCVRCLNHCSLAVDEVHYHLFIWGIDVNYTRWIKHGEKDEPTTSSRNSFDANQFDVVEIPADAAETIEMVKATEDNFVDDLEKFQELLADAEKPLYKGCPNFTKLSASVQLLNLKSKHGVTNKCFTELLILLKRMPPAEGNEMVSNTYEAKKIMTAMGSGYEKIHACINNCILYRKEYKDLVVCPTCGMSRWKVDEKTKVIYKNVPTKVLWYFPLIPRLKRLYKVKSISKDLIWHSTSSKKPGVLRHPSDSPAWKAIDDRFPEIASDPRNLRLGISTDGVDVNRGNRNHSVWPVLTVIYNLPPWLCMKRKFIMLSLLISGTPGNDIDVFLDPLIDDMELLFEEGVETFDAYAQEKFTLRAVVLWMINDYPALGALCGCPYSGFNGCVVCRKETHCVRLPFSAKQSYGGHRRYLPYSHPFRKQTKAFNGREEWGTAANPMTGEEIFNEVKFVRNKWGKGFKDKGSEIMDTSTGRGRKTKNQNQKGVIAQILDTKNRSIGRNSTYGIDDLGIGGIICIIGTLLNVPGKTKDGLQARKDLAHFGIRQELQAKTQGNTTVLPAACYTLTKDEKDKFCETLHNLRAPQGYCSNFSSLVNQKDRKLKYFTTSFLDLMLHLTVNLVREVKLCGPICFRWMYPFERFMKVIKGHVRNKAYPEGCIAEENIVEETSTTHLKMMMEREFLFVPYIEQHMTFLKNKHPGKRQAWLEKEHSTMFGHWLRNKVESELSISTESVSETVKWISHGAHTIVNKYDVYDINGYTFRTKVRDGRIHQNSGVCVEATEMHISKEVVTYGKNFYYGVLREIWVLDYHIKKISLFMCDWVDNRNGVKQDSMGYTLVELNRLGHKDDPFILASQARQVFYVKDQLDKKMSIVLMTPAKNYRDLYDDVNEDFSTVILPHNDNILPPIDPRDLGNESRDDYFRQDCLCKGEGLIMMSSSNSYISNQNRTDLCYCGLPARIRTSNTLDNPGRRFRVCHKSNSLVR